jgi:predicted nucleic-acid-binding protein
MESYHLDTSVVMRLLVQEPADQYIHAAGFLEEKLAAGASASVCDLTLTEAYFALQSFYGVPKAEALELLAGFIRTPGLLASSHARVILSIPNLASAKPGFADRLIHGAAVSADRTLVTFEKATKNLPKVIVLGD